MKPIFSSCRQLSMISILLLLSCNAIPGRVSAQPQLELEEVIGSGLNSPTQVVSAYDGSKRLFIVQKQGTIRVYNQSFQFLSLFLTVPNITDNGERGLLSMAFHPDYENNGFFYVYYTNANGDLELARYKVSSDPNVADAASKAVLITIPHPVNDNHNGGELHFGNDGLLYLSTGDGGGGGDPNNNAQNTSVLLGKILRFQVNTSASAPFYTVPAGNPFGNEVFAYGLRNPYRWEFDRQTQDMWIGDVGQDEYEEINHMTAAEALGANYGWRCYEGNQPYNATGCGQASDYDFPIHTYATQNPAASVTGGTVYRGSAYPGMQGYYLAADFYSGEWYKIITDGGSGWTVTTQNLSPKGIVDIGENEDGELFALSNIDNSLHRIKAQGANAITPRKTAETGRIYPSVAAERMVYVYLPVMPSYQLFEVLSLEGKTILSVDVKGRSGTISQGLSDLASGMYFCRLSGTAGEVVQKVYVP